MLSRQEVTQIEQYQRQEEFEEKEKEYGYRLQAKIAKLEKEKEKLQKTLGFYLGEDVRTKHPLEEEYSKLASMIPNKRNAKQNARLAELAQILSVAVDVSNQAFKDELDKHR